MTPHQTIAVVVRLFAIWLAVYAARMIPAFYRELGGTEDATARLVAIVVAILIALGILFLWMFPRSIARVLLDSSPLTPTEPVSADTWLAIGCALLGVWLIVPALASIVYNLTALYLAQRDPRMDTSGMRPAWIYYAVELGFGIWLLLGARGLRKAFWAMRNGH